MNSISASPDFFEDESGISTIELVLILVVLISLVLIFKSSITSLLNTIFSQINSQAGEVYKK
ncbi:MAG: Flp1 family type IVb pilin [Bacillota bacterium]|nr:Flp1 family type IVb pilin [Bacillota bacterium]